ncbi:MAG: hypothetical protein ACIAQ0_02015 [Phycisphaerales bacterium JB058]
MARKRRKPPTARERITEWVYDHITANVISIVLTGVVLTVGMGVGISFADSRAAEIAADGPPTVRIHWPDAVSGDQNVNWPPQAVQKDLLDDAYEIGGNHSGHFSARTLDELGVWLARSGWVSHIDAINRLDEGVIEIKARWRSPGAVVRDGAHDYLIATDGRRLKASWRADFSPFPVIVGARDANPLAVVPGQKWENESIQAGLELLNLLHARLPGTRGADQVRGIDVSQFPRFRRLIILTDAGNRIIWGRMPSDPVPDAVSTEGKLRQLTYLRQHPDFGRRIDAGRKLIDVSSGPILVEDTP